MEQLEVRPPISRRGLVQSATLALFAGLTPARGDARGRAMPAGGRARRCILIYLLGGPSHLDIWDLKPGAPSEIRGPFKPISTSVPGIQICEHLPKLAQQAHRLALVRSVTYPNNDHPFMIYHTLTGRISPDPLGANTVLPPKRSDHPHLGSVVAKFRHRNPAVPGYVALPELRVRMGSSPVSGGGRAGFLGPAYDPLAINDDPREPVMDLHLPEQVSLDRLERRQSLLALVEGHPPHSPVAREYAEMRQAGTRLIRAAGAEDLFSTQREPAALQDRYGRHRFGQSLMLARHLVEGGVSFVAVHFNYMSKCDGWDTHARNFDCLKGELLPLLDQSVAALIDDLASRSMLDDTLVVIMGEFGRTPIINGDAGRDHWGHCGSVVFAGGGIRGGTVIGASDDHAAYPREAAVGPPDLVASIYHALGLTPASIMHDAFLDRPMTLCDGKAIEGLF